MKNKVFQAAIMAWAVLFSSHGYAADAPSASPEEIAAARAFADAEIAKQQVGDLFENVTDSDVPTVRHRASGMSCSAGDNPQDIWLHVYESGPRGDDVSCGSSLQGVTTTMYATRYGDGFSAEDALQGAIQAIQQTAKDVRPYRGDAVSMSVEDKNIPTPLTARFEAVMGGKKVFTRTSAVAVGDWIIAQRVTAPVEKTTLADLVAEMNLATTLIGMLPPADAP